MEYTIIRRGEVPTGSKKWQYLFSQLDNEEAVKFESESKDELACLGRSLLGCFRYDRRDGFKLVTRIVKLTASIYALFVWKENRYRNNNQVY